MSNEVLYLEIMTVVVIVMSIYITWKMIIPEMREKQRKKEVLRRGREAGMSPDLILKEIKKHRSEQLDFRRRL